LSRDHSRYVRWAVIEALKAASSTIPADRLYPQQVPANPNWPYGFVGVPISTPDRADCLDGGLVSFAIHGYARSESQANEIGEEYVIALDQITLPLPAPYPADVELNWISNTTVRDPSETTAFHVISQFEATVSS
jgi:hypothetical protein